MESWPSLAYGAGLENQCGVKAPWVQILHSPPNKFLERSEYDSSQDYITDISISIYISCLEIYKQID